MDTTLIGKDMTLVLNENGYVTSLKILGTEILKEDSPFLRLCENNAVYLPVSMTKNDKAYTFVFENGETVGAFLTEEPPAVRVKLTEVPEAADAVIFGTIKVTLDEVVGEVIAVAQGGDLAFGMMALNIKTVEGFPQRYSDLLEEAVGFNASNANISVGGLPVHERAAVQLGGGGCGLQFYGQDRTRFSYGKVVGAEHARIEPLRADDPDAYIKGAELLIYGCGRKEILARIGEIESAYGLPHPEIDGEWEKTGRRAMKSYLISEFDADEVDMVLDKAELAGLDTIYHGEPFRTWGHFEWQENLAENDADFYQKVTAKAKARGMHVGLHTLTNFTTTNDAFVTPVPNEGLLKLAEVELTDGISEADTDIRLTDDIAFDTALTLNGVQIENEIVTYVSVSRADGVLVLQGVTRGAYGTGKAAHAAGTAAYLLRDYPYKTFFPDIYLQDKMADRLVELFNNCEVDQISFDGLEGCTYTGHGIYACTRFVMRCADGWDHFVLNDGSNLHHYNWHYNTRMNWGEPWGQAMRTGQVENRIRNQDFFRRNLFPRMLGWFLLRLSDRKFEASSREDTEWALSEAAGFDAGFAMTVKTPVMKKHGRIDELMGLIRDWERLRLANVFTEEQKARLRKPENEFRLEKTGENSYKLYPVAISDTFTCALSEMQPGQPGGADWSVTNPMGASFAFRLRVAGEGEITDPSFSNASGMIKFPCTIGENQYLLYDPDGRCEVTDRNYRKIETVTPVGKLQLPHGNAALAFACSHDKYDTPDVMINFITLGEGEDITV